MVESVRDLVAEVMLASRAHPPWSRLVEILLHDLMLRLPDAFQKLEGGASSVPPNIGLRFRVFTVRRVLAKVWNWSSRTRDAQGDIPGPPSGGRLVCLLDPAPTRRAENRALTSMLTTAGSIVVEPETTLRSRLVGAKRALFLIALFPLALRVARGRAIAITSSSTAEPRGAGLKSLSVRFSVVAENYCIVDPQVMEFARRCRRNGSDGLLIFRNGGAQVASSARRYSRRLDLRTLHVVHSSATGENIPESSSHADAIVARSARQASDLDVGVARVFALGRIPRLSAPGPAARDRGGLAILLAMTHRSVAGMTTEEWVAFNELFAWGAALPDASMRIRFKNASSGSASLARRGAPKNLLAAVSTASLDEDIRSSDTVIVVMADGHCSTVLQDAASAGVGVLNTSLGSPSVAKASPSLLQQNSFVRIEELLRMTSTAIRARVTATAPLEENERDFTAEELLAAVGQVVGREMGRQRGER